MERKWRKKVPKSASSLAYLIGEKELKKYKKNIDKRFAKIFY